MVKVRLATPLRKYSQGKPEIEVEGSTIKEVIDNIDAQSEGFAERILENGELKQFVNIFHNNEDIRFKEGLATELEQEDVLSILPAVSGG